MAIRPAPLAAPSPLYYSEVGSGRPVVLLHGLGCDGRLWDGVRPHLAARHRVLTPDLPGHGQSPRPYKAYTLRLYTDYLIRWLEAVAPGPVDLVGHSFSGAIAMALALERPDLVRSVAAVASIRLAEHRPPKGALRAFIRYGLTLLCRAASPAETSRYLRQGFGLSAQSITPELVALFQETGRVSTRALLSTNRHMASPAGRLFDRLDQVKCPVWLLWGDRDPLYPGREKVEQIVDRLGQASFELIDAGHLPMVEQADGFRERLLSHLNRV